jgi:hypothetical protein
MAATTTINPSTEITDTPSITDRALSLTKTRAFAWIKEGPSRSVIERAVAGEEVNPVFLEKALVHCESHIAESKRRNKRNKLSGEVGKVTDQKWFVKFTAARESVASTITAPAHDASMEDLLHLETAINAAWEWNRADRAARRENFDKFLQGLNKRRDDAMSFEEELEEFQYKFGPAHAAILRGLTEGHSDVVIDDLKAALNEFFAWKDGGTETKLREMGLKPAPRTNGRGGRKAKGKGSRQLTNA